MELPCPLKLMKVFGSEMVEVFLQHLQQLQPPGEQRLVGRVVGADAADVLVHELLEPLKAMDWQDVAR